MTNPLFSIRVSGKFLNGFDPSLAKNKFAQLFHLSDEKTELIFNKAKQESGLSIKKEIGEQDAAKYHQALEKIGVEAHIIASQNKSIENQKLSSEAAIPTSSASASKPSAQTPSQSPPSPPPSASAASAAADKTKMSEQHAFIFHGKGNEYFRIWIVNVFLTILTLGIYSAWAKVRNAQYFYSHTELAGNRFRYLAKPITILIGRLIAVGLFVALSLLSNVNPMAGTIASFALILILPWVVMRSLRFNRRMSAWRNIRFQFDGSLAKAYMAFLVWPLIGIISLGLLFPFALYKQAEFIINHSSYGTSRFKLNPCLNGYYKYYLPAFLILLGAGALTYGLGTLLDPFSIIPGIVMMTAYFYLFVYITVNIQNTLFNNISLHEKDFSFNSFWKLGSYWKLLATNSLFTVLTLGFYMPWAKVRTAHYKANHIQLMAQTELDNFIAAQEQEVSALGEEMGDIFDMEVGL